MYFASLNGLSIAGEDMSRTLKAVYSFEVFSRSRGTFARTSHLSFRFTCCFSSTYQFAKSGLACPCAVSAKDAESVHEMKQNEQKEREKVVRAHAKHAASRTFVEGKEEIKYLYDVGRSLQNKFNPKLKHDAFYRFKTVSALQAPTINALHDGGMPISEAARPAISS